MRTELAALNEQLPRLGWVDIAERRTGAIKLSPVPAQPEPRNLRRIKAEVLRRWGNVPLIDMLKEAVLRTGCLNTVTSVATGGSIAPDVLAQRLLLAIYAYGTNTGIKAVAAGGHGHSEDEIRHRDPRRHRFHRGDPASVHPQRLPPHLCGDARGRARPEDHLLCPLPAPAGLAARNRGRPERDGVLQRR